MTDTIQIEAAAWRDGYRDGYAGQKSQAATLGGLAGLSYASGFVEGKGDRDTGKPSAETASDRER